MGSDSVACEYAKCKNRLYMLTVGRHPFDYDICNACCPCRFSRKIEMNDNPRIPAPKSEPAVKKELPAAAQRALAEAEARRVAAAAENTAARAKELQGPEGPEPTRFGDWERKGIASDF
jgi:hypothetical protein